jgi:glutamate-5-semialdehyde dehydrogenase
VNALNVAEYMQTLGLQARQAAARMSVASTAAKNAALRSLAAKLRASVAPLATENARDIERARAAGLAAPMVDRLKLTPKIVETLAQGCEQLAAMPDIIGEVRGMTQQPSGIRVGQMRVPIGVFGTRSRRCATACTSCAWPTPPILTTAPFTTSWTGR